MAAMRKVTSKEFDREMGAIKAMARKEPITITDHERPTWVIMPFEEYMKVFEVNKVAMKVSDLDRDLLARILSSKVPEEFDPEFNK
jgi:hypothetical protein